MWKHLYSHSYWNLKSDLISWFKLNNWEGLKQAHLSESNEVVHSSTLTLWNKAPRDFLSHSHFLPQVSFCWRSPASWKLLRWRRRLLSLTARSLMWFSVRHICSGKTPSWDLFSAFHELMSLKKHSLKNQSVSLPFLPIFSPSWSRKFPPGEINFHLSYNSYQPGKVRVNTCLLQDTWSQTLHVFEVLFMLHHTLYTQAHRSPLIASVPVIDGGESNGIPPTQTAQSVLLSWLLATDGCGTFRVQACKCHYLLRLPFQPIGIRDKQNHSMLCISHVVTGFFV